MQPTNVESQTPEDEDEPEWVNGDGKLTYARRSEKRPVKRPPRGIAVILLRSGDDPGERTGANSPAYPQCTMIKYPGHRPASNYYPSCAIRTLSRLTFPGANDQTSAIPSVDDLEKDRRQRLNMSLKIELQ